jgi:hypothetical protein
MPRTIRNTRTAGAASALATVALAVVLSASTPTVAATSYATPCSAETRSQPPAVNGREGCVESRQAAPHRWMQMSNRPSDGRTGGTPETSARVPGGPPDDVNAGLTFAIPSLNVF